MRNWLILAVLCVARLTCAQTSTNIDNSAFGWKPVCFLPSCNPGGSGTPSVTPTQTFNNPIPSKDGASMKLSLQGPARTNALWTYLNGTTNQTNFHFHANVQPSTGFNTALAQIEIDQFLFNRVNMIEYMFGSQCDRDAGLWEFWNQLTTAWVNSAIPCTALDLPANQLTPVEEWVHLVPGETTQCSGEPCMYYDGISVNGKYSSIGLTLPAGPLPGTFAQVTGLQFQINTGSAGGTVNESIDLAEFDATSVPYPPALSRTIVANQSTVGQSYKITNDGTHSQICNGGPPYYCGRSDVIRHATPPPSNLVGLLGRGQCAIDPELGAQICRVTDGSTNAFRGFRTQSDSNSGTVSLDGSLFSFIDSKSNPYLMSVDVSTVPPTFSYRGRCTTCWSQEAVSFSHQFNNVIYGNIGGVNQPYITRTVIHQADSHYLTATATSDLSGTTAVSTNATYLDPSAANCLGLEYAPFFSTSDLYNADANDRYISMHLRGSQDEGFLMIYFDTTIPGCHWLNTRTMTEGGTWGYNSTALGALGSGTGTGPILNQNFFVLPIPPAPTVAALNVAGGTLVPGNTYGFCVSLVQFNVGETPCSTVTSIALLPGTGCSGLPCNAVRVTAPNIHPTSTIEDGTGYNTYACTPAPGCTPTLQFDSGATNPMTIPTGYSIACTAGCTGTQAYDYTVWLFALFDAPTATGHKNEPGYQSPPTLPFNICSTARAGCNLVGTFGNNPTWTIHYTPPTGATHISINRACNNPVLPYCATPQNFVWTQVKAIVPCAVPPCTVTAALAGGGGDNVRTYQVDSMSTDTTVVANAVINGLLTTTPQPVTINGTGTKVHDNRGAPDGKWAMISSTGAGNFSSSLLNGVGGPMLHHHQTGFTALVTTGRGGAAGNPFNIISAAVGHKVIGYGTACAQDTLTDGIMTTCWPLVDSPAGMEAGLRRLNSYFLGFPEDNGAHHMGIQGQAPYPGVFNPVYPMVHGVTQFERVDLPTSALVGTVYAVGLGLPGYSPLSGANAGQTNNQNPQIRLCSNYNSATSDDGSGAFDSEVSGNFAPDGRTAIFTSDMGIGSAPLASPAAWGGPQLGDINGNFPAVCGAGSTLPGSPAGALCADSRTDIYWCGIIR